MYDITDMRVLIYYIYLVTYKHCSWLLIQNVVECIFTLKYISVFGKIFKIIFCLLSKIDSRYLQKIILILIWSVWLLSLNNTNLLCCINYLQISANYLKTYIIMSWYHVALVMAL